MPLGACPRRRTSRLADARTCYEQLKYQQLLRPHDALTLSLRYDANRGKLHFSCDNGHGKCASGRIVYDLP